MRRNRLWTDAVREVRRTMGRFLSLFLLSALAVAFLAGLRTTAPDMERSADSYYDAQGLMDVRVLSTLGLTDEDIATLADQPGVEKAEGAYTADAIVGGLDNDFIVKALSISALGINAPRLTAGRLPEGDGECLVEPSLLAALGLSLGDSIALDTGTGTFEDALTRKDFAIVGTADSPLFISKERGSSSLGSGRVAAFILLPVGAFAMAAYTDAYLIADGGAALLSYDQAYQDLADGLIDGLEPLGDQLAKRRYDDIIGEANETLNDAQAEFDDAEAEANQELDDARKKLADARKKLDNGWADYYDGRATYDKEIAEAQQKIADAEQIDLPDALKKLEDGEADYTDGQETYRDGQQKYQDGLRDYYDGLTDYQTGQEEYADGYAELTGQDATYNLGLEALQQGEAEYAKGVLDYTRGLDELQEAGRLIDENQRKLKDANETLFAGSSALNTGLAQYEEQKALFDGTVAALKAQYQFPGTDEEFLALLAEMPDPTGQLAQLLGAGQQLAAAKSTLDSSQGSLRWGQMEYDDGKKKLSDAKKLLDDGVADLQAAHATLTDSRKELDDGWRTLYDGQREMDDGWGTLDEARQTLLDAEVELSDAWKKLEDARIELEDGKLALDDARIELDDGWADYRQGLADLDEAKITLADEQAKGLTELRDAKLDLDDGQADYAQGLVEYEDGRAEADEKLSDARRELNDARRKISDIEHCKWYVLGRNTNMGYVSFQQDAQRMGNLASVFPLIFFLVAALVCLTTMTRMVEEHRVQIGGLKALGYGKWAISVKYVGYGLAASLLGSIAGLAFGCTVIPTIIYTAWSILYTLGPLEIPFYPGISLLSAGAAVLTVVGAAFFTCWGALAAVPAALMRPKAPKSGKRVLLEYIKPLWSRLSFSHKVTVRNLFRYQRRFWMTVVGIGGCTALIVTGFGLRDSIFSIMEKQYVELYSYTSQIGLVDDVTVDELTEIGRALDAQTGVTSHLMAHQSSQSVESDTRAMDGTVMAPLDDEAFPTFIHLRHRLDDAPVALAPDGAVVTEKLASLLGVAVGDEITLAGDRRVTVRISHIAEHYIGHYVYLSPDYYQSVYGAPPDCNMILARYAEDTRAMSDQVSAALIPLSGVTSVSRISDTRSTYQSSLESVDYAVVVVIASAAALAFVVLFNLTNINITERMRELATLKVLGFNSRELGAYVFRENALLTLFGILAGLVMGKFLHQWLVLTVEIDMLMFGRTAKPMSYLYAVLLTLLFSLVVNWISGRKLDKIDMVESLKTVE